MARAVSARLLAPAETGRSSLADRAYYAIRESIVTLALEPGSVLSERELIERLGIGRTPVREALRRLAQEKLVEVYPRRGMFVTTVDMRDLARLCEVRLALEPAAARFAAERATEADLVELRGLFDELERDDPQDWRGLMDLDERIHRAVYRAGHNRFLEETLEEYYALALRIWVMATHHKGALHEAVLEHGLLLGAILGGNGRKAESIMREHVAAFERAMRDALLEA
jgi:DNA-binding GntR family transcriptional regulator